MSDFGAIAKYTLRRKALIPTVSSPYTEKDSKAFNAIEARPIWAKKQVKLNFD